MLKKLMLFVCFLIFVATSFAAKVETVNIKSQAMNKEIPTLVISHEHLTEVGSPVIYLLHGYAGNEKSWSIIQPKLQSIADRYNLIFVCPYGENNWYLDSPIDKSIRYETFISSELVKYIDAHYATGENKSARAITGFSMGGYGAIRTAILHPEIFGAAGSASGAFELINLPSIPIDTSPRKDFNISSVLGKDKKLWKQYSLFNTISKTQKIFPAIIIDCGYNDTLVFNTNNKFHKKLLENNIAHDYIVRPGGHDITYWQNAIEYQILFFINYFAENYYNSGKLKI
ncbi:alpha/beta hydrolase [Endomicrobium proavitum]|uniref:Esterase n=1 Tax=Endomicrobium proavitum TaxID=1408281 RepID=A0A0G3WL60_9BACT|nr:alpha/beta hydrolase family protein [Endomicrobium proavitum]AKL98620.1 conserved exported protein of unknown function [Endomicrobium proavitum]